LPRSYYLAHCGDKVKGEEKDREPEIDATSPEPHAKNRETKHVRKQPEFKTDNSSQLDSSERSSRQTNSATE